MIVSSRPGSRILRPLLAIAFVIGGVATLLGALPGFQSQAHAAGAMHMNCKQGSPICTEVYDSESVFGENVYVGHDEPSTLFYSNVPGSGNRMQYQLTLPKDPPPSAPLTPGKTFNFELHPAFWFGMAMCDTQSYPELLSTCTPDSDSNIVDPAVSPNHPGTAFMEMQFYPPGWAPWPEGVSCDATKWCAALNIDSLSENPVTGQVLNSACQSVAGLEYVNFAFLTKNGVPQPNSPPNPVDSTINTFTPNRAADLFMNSGDRLAVTMHDTAHGLQIVVNDLTTHQSGSMTSSAANGFGQVQFAPDPSTACNNIPYDFHPMYNTSSEQTRVTWAAHSYNIAFSDEIGHFDFCNGSNPITPGASCPTGNTEGSAADSEPTDNNPLTGDDFGCFPASSSTLVDVPGCLGTNTGFDGVPYQSSAWPDGNTRLHPTAIQFTSPLTGRGYDIRYSRAALEADLPRIEDPTVCDRNTGVGCTLIPTTDDPAPGGGFQPAAFYPFFSIGRGSERSGNACVWMLGNRIPGSITDFGQNRQYGPLLQLTYTAVGGGSLTRFNNFRQVFSRNPC